MKVKLMGALTIAIVLLLVFAVVAQASTPQSIIDQIIKDAKDGRIDGNWTVAEIRDAIRLRPEQPHPRSVLQDLGTLEDYLASLLGPGEQGGQLAFTGGEMFLILGAGAGLIARWCAVASPPRLVAQHSTIDALSTERLPRGEALRSSLDDSASRPPAPSRRARPAPSASRGHRRAPAQPSASLPGRPRCARAAPASSRRPR